MSESCKTCRFWSEYGEVQRIRSGSTETVLAGHCRRRAPQLTQRGDSAPKTAFPLMFDCEWCGEYQSAEWTREWVELGAGNLSCRCVNALEKNGLMRRLSPGRYLLSKSVLSMTVDDLTSLRGVALTLANEITQVLQGN